MTVHRKLLKEMVDYYFIAFPGFGKLFDQRLLNNKISYIRKRRWYRWELILFLGAGCFYCYNRKYNKNVSEHLRDYLLFCFNRYSKSREHWQKQRERKMECEKNLTESLSEKERQVTKLLLLGYGPEKLVKEMKISISTIHLHIRNIQKKGLKIISIKQKESRRKILYYDVINST